MTLKEHRLKKEMTQQEVANKIGVDVATYNRYERGKLKVDKKTLMALSVVFNTTEKNITL